jgi:hypothetical protein
MNRILPGILIGMLVIGASSAAVLHVPGEYGTIQEALDAAAADDTVLVAPGAYEENIVWPGTQGIDLLSEAGAGSTVIDGGDAGRVVTIDSAALVDSFTVIRGFTITHGHASGSGMDAFGAGIFCNGSSPKVRDNFIVDNSADYSGGGMACKMCSPVIEGNVISSNLAVYNGGGICCSHAHPSIVDNTVEGNTAGFNGGGINLIYSEAAVWGNEILWNHADNGGGINCNFGDPVIEYNMIEENDADVRGGGICCKGTSPVIRHNLLTGNDALGVGDGIHCSEGSSPWVHENDIFSNGVGLRNDDDTVTIVAQDNWWGHPSGPFHPGLNPGGTGDEVSDFVEFDPWLRGPYRVLEGDVHPREGPRTLWIAPNPFRGDVEVRFVLPRSGRGSLKVYDRAGRGIATLFDDIRSSGKGCVRWRTDGLPRGVYFFRLESAGLGYTEAGIRLD